MNFSLSGFLILIFFCLMLFGQNAFSQEVTKKSLCPDALKLEESGNYKAALPVWKQCLDQNPDSLSVQIGLAVCKSRAGLGEESFSDFRRILSAHPADHGAQYYYGMGLFLQNKYDETVKFTADMLKKYPENYSLLALSGYAKQMLGNADGAIPDFSSYLRTDSSSVDALAARGQCYLDKENFEAASQDFSNAIALDPKNPEHFVSRGICRKVLKETQAAMADFNKAIQLNSTFNRAFLERGRLKFTLGDERGAIGDYDAALKIDANDVLSLYFRSVSRMRVKDLNGALSDINKCITLDPQNGAAYFTRGWIKIDLKNSRGACQDFSKAGELGFLEAYEAIKENCR